ncbi:alpha/beta fold hydrolase [Paenibacillus segetis]|uniref:2-hydroxy-6-oxo-6-phenylhexa-2,4-dienoate hydrolase n=1 Tax=Paenibacillus segetis TaxID=1325360 RepID=A0ABQ1Y264_9BACL|nr:alpha/beta hydrolase [Paenibacillus segetis]GGH10256.1 2-hydroxy-6-oxo-6-phenylhexa-2,4-dienoate hydrolase [Paenibacillus segetis]
MNKEIKNTLKLLDTDLYYEIYGEGIPILMIHGWGVNHHIMSGCMEPIFKDVMQNFKRIYIDLPGMGQSKPGNSVKRSDDILDVILAFIDKVIPDQQFLLVGESYGGYLARALIKERSPQILGLLLICPLIYPGHRQGQVEPLTVMEKDELFLESLNEHERSSFEYLSVVLNEKTWERFKVDIYDELSNKDDYFLDNVLEGAFSYDIDKLDTPFEQPSLILVGRQDTEVGYKDQFALLENYPRASFVVLDKAGHNLQIEQGDLFNQLVIEWLDRMMG